MFQQKTFKLIITDTFQTQKIITAEIDVSPSSMLSAHSTFMIAGQWAMGSCLPLAFLFGNDVTL